MGGVTVLQFEENASYVLLFADVNSVKARGIILQCVWSSLSLSGLTEKLNGLMNRQGSSGEIGWAMDNVGDPVQDETELFYSIFEGLKWEITNVFFLMLGKEISFTAFHGPFLGFL